MFFHAPQEYAFEIRVLDEKTMEYVGYSPTPPRTQPKLPLPQLVPIKPEQTIIFSARGLGNCRFVVLREVGTPHYFCLHAPPIFEVFGRTIYSQLNSEKYQNKFGLDLKKEYECLILTNKENPPDVKQEMLEQSLPVKFKKFNVIKTKIPGGHDTEYCLPTKEYPNGRLRVFRDGLHHPFKEEFYSDPFNSTSVTVKNETEDDKRFQLQKKLLTLMENCSFNKFLRQNRWKFNFHSPVERIFEAKPDLEEIHKLLTELPTGITPENYFHSDACISLNRLLFYEKIALKTCEPKDLETFDRSSWVDLAFVARVCEEKKAYVDAIDYYNKAIEENFSEVDRSKYGSEKIQYAYLLLAIARVYQKQNKFSEAVSIYDKIIKTVEPIVPKKLAEPNMFDSDDSEFKEAQSLMKICHAEIARIKPANPPQPKDLSGGM